MRREKRKPTKPKPDPVLKLALNIGIPGSQIRRGDFAIRDVANHSEADQRDMQSLKRTRTIRRKTRLEKLHQRKVINDTELKACEWYHDAHAMRYDTSGITAKYGASGHRGTSFDHLPKNRDQEIAFWNFDFAREGICPSLRGLFDRVVIHGRPLDRLTRTFRLAVNQLITRIEGRVALK